MRFRTSQSWMRWRTYDRLRAEDTRLMQAFDRGFCYSAMAIIERSENRIAKSRAVSIDPRTDYFHSGFLLKCRAVEASSRGFSEQNLIDSQMRLVALETDMPSKGFLAVDVRRIQQACQLGLNPAVSYIVLAAGTGKDQSTTSWSVNAIEKYTSISRGRSQKASGILFVMGLIDQVEKGSKPRYKLKPWSDQFEDQIATMKIGGQRLLKAAAAREAPDSEGPRFSSSTRSGRPSEF